MGVFSQPPSNLPYNATTWNNKKFTSPSMDVIRDQIETMLLSTPTASDVAYDATSWNANTDVPTKNAVRDQIEAMLLSIEATDLPLTGDGMDFPAATAGQVFQASGTSCYVGGTTRSGATAGLFVNAPDRLLCVTTTAAGSYAVVGSAWIHIRRVISMPDGDRVVLLSSNTSITPVAGENGFGFIANVLWKIENGVLYPIDSNRYEEIWIPASSMTPTTTNGAAAGTNEYATNDIMAEYLAFDGATEEFAMASFPMPSGWDRGTFKAKFMWTSATGSTAGDTVEWEIAAGAVSNDDAIDAALGTAQVISDALLANNGTDHQTSGATPAITCGGTPALGDYVRIKVSRNVGGTDDMTEDAWLLGVWLQIKLTNSVAAW